MPTGKCHYADLVFVASMLAAHEPEPTEECTEPARYTVTIATDRDGFVIEIRTPMCPVHEAHASFNSGYVRSTKLRDRSPT